MLGGASLVQKGSGDVSSPSVEAVPAFMAAASADAVAAAAVASQTEGGWCNLYAEAHGECGAPLHGRCVLAPASGAPRAPHAPPRPRATRA